MTFFPTAPEAAPAPPLRAAPAGARRRYSRGGHESERAEARPRRDQQPALDAGFEEGPETAAVEEIGDVEKQKRAALGRRNPEPRGRRPGGRRVLVARRGRPGIARPGERPHRGELRGGRRRIERVRRHLAQLGHDRGRADHVAAAVPRHAEALRERLREKGPFGSECQRAGVFAAENKRLVDLIRDDPEVLGARPVDHRLDPAARQNPAARIVGRREVERGGSGGPPSLEPRDETFRGFTAEVDRHRHRRTVKGTHDALDERPVGRQDQHLVARFEERPSDRPEPAGRARGDQHVLAFER